MANAHHAHAVHAHAHTAQPPIHACPAAACAHAPLCRCHVDFLAAVGASYMALGHAQAVGWCDTPAHDRLLLGASNAAFALAAWRAGRLYALLQERGAVATGGVDAAAGSRSRSDARRVASTRGHGGFLSRAAEGDARVALRALDWGACGVGLELAVHEQVSRRRSESLSPRQC
jgi:hypothetical protein